MERIKRLSGGFRPTFERPATGLIGAIPCHLLTHLLTIAEPVALVARPRGRVPRSGARFIQAPSPAAAVDALMAGGHANANRLTLAYRADMLERRKLASASIARRLAALRSLVKLARQLGRINWSIDIESPRVTSYRDTSGPGLDGWRRIRKAADGNGKLAKRDMALIRLLHDLGLRRGEAIAMDLADVDMDAGEHGQIRIIGKGKREPEILQLESEPAREALREWLVAGGDEPGPLFIRLDRAADGERLERLTGDSVARMVRRLSRRAKLKRDVRPHALRHQPITRALDKTGGNVRMVRAFSRHAKIETLMLYDDHRVNHAGKVSRLLGEDD
jgi:integrase/recombinase XerC